MQIRVLSLALLVAAGSMSGCSDDFQLPNSSGVPTAPDNSTSTTTGEPPTTATSSEGTTAADTTTTDPTVQPTSSTTDPSGGGMCNLYDQDCPGDQKCTAYASPNTFIPEGIKCVPVPDNPKAAGEPCSVGAEGLGDDNCALGTVCLDLDYDGTGFCLPYCTGDSQNPMCEGSDTTCVKLFFGYDFGNCFKQCDPLLQNCAEGEGCYMDAIKVGNTNFVCLPVVQGGAEATFQDTCIGWSSCAPGYACVYDSFVPDCSFSYCCTPWCDLSEGDAPCQELDEKMSCIAWYSQDQAPPGLENVGVCGIPE
jgi:hypothetical protein